MLSLQFADKQKKVFSVFLILHIYIYVIILTECLLQSAVLLFAAGDDEGGGGDLPAVHLRDTGAVLGPGAGAA